MSGGAQIWCKSGAVPVEADTWYRMADGSLVHTRQSPTTGRFYAQDSAGVYTPGAIYRLAGQLNSGRASRVEKP